MVKKIAIEKICVKCNKIFFKGGWRIDEINNKWYCSDCTNQYLDNYTKKLDGFEKILKEGNLNKYWKQTLKNFKF